MDGQKVEPTESQRLQALILWAVGWQLDELHVLQSGPDVLLIGHAHSAHARALAVAEAERLLGRAVEDRMEVN